MRLREDGVGPVGQEVREGVVEDEVVEQVAGIGQASGPGAAEPVQLLVADGARSGRSGAAPRTRHSHSCEREISAVAASSIRLSMAAAPVPCSQASR